MLSFHKSLIPMSEIIKEYIRKSNAQYIEQIIKKNKNDKKKYLLASESSITNPNNNNHYFVFFGLLTMSISTGIYFLLRKK